MPENKLPLRTLGDVISAQEWIFQNVQIGRIDQKTADALNTCVKGQSYLLGKLRLDVANLLVKASIKKVDLPEGLLPELTIRKSKKHEDDEQPATA
jgi:hypothetical protein